MLKNFIGKWGLLIAGIIFLIAAIIPFVQGDTVKVTFFVIGIALLIAGIAIVRKKRTSTLPKR